MEETTTPINTQITVPEIHALTETDRNESGQLTPEARERALEEIEVYRRATGMISTSIIKKKLGIGHWDTARQLMKQVAERIVAESTDDVLSHQLQYYFKLIERVPKEWETFQISNSKEEEEVISAYYGKIDGILRLKYTPDQVIAGSPAAAMNLAIFNTMSPKVQEFVRSNYGVDPEKIKQEEETVILTQAEPVAEVVEPSIVKPIIDEEPK